jgi:hypothetical protein
MLRCSNCCLRRSGTLLIIDAQFLRGARQLSINSDEYHAAAGAVYERNGSLLGETRIRNSNYCRTLVTI